MLKDDIFRTTVVFLFSVCGLLAIDVYDRSVWLLENLLVVLVALPFFFYLKKGVLSKTSVILCSFFLVLHSIGAHYTYSLVPYQSWFNFFIADLFPKLEPGRNYYDRFLHLLFGVVIYLPLREIYAFYMRPARRMPAYMSILTIIAASTIYELLEWAVAITFGGDAGMAFIGIQGDMWDTHKDLALALLGALAVFFFSEIKSKFMTAVEYVLAPD